MRHFGQQFEKGALFHNRDCGVLELRTMSKVANHVCIIASGALVMHRQVSSERRRYSFPQTNVNRRDETFVAPSCHSPTQTH